MERKQFTFYRSYFEAVKELPKREQCAVILAICDYALDENEPNLTGTAKAIFSLIRPTLDASRRKANGGMNGSPKKDSGKINESSDEDTAKEKKKEKENKKENKCYTPNPQEAILKDTGFGPVLQAAFEDWIKYKTEKRQGYKPTGLKSLVTEVRNQAAKHGEEEVAKLIRECMASNWQGIIFERLNKPEPKQTWNPGGSHQIQHDKAKPGENANRMRAYLQQQKEAANG